MGRRVTRPTLLDALLLAIPTNQGVKDGQDMPAIFNHAGKNVAQPRLAFRFPVPLSENRRGHLNVAAELFRGVAAEEQTVEKGSFALGKIEIQRKFRGNELCHCGHGEKAVYRKASRRQVVPRLGCCVAGNPDRTKQGLDAVGASLIQRLGCREDSNRLRIKA